MSLPAPSATTLREQLRLSLGSDDAFLWRQRLLQERLMRNITEKQERVLQYVRELIDQGVVQFTHAEVAIALVDAGIGTVKDALKRAQGIGLIDWRPDYRPGPNGSRRRIANIYRLSMPQHSPVPRPDLRRRSVLKSKPVQEGRTILRLPSCAPQCDERGETAVWALGAPAAGFAERFAAKIAEEKRQRAAWRWRGPPR
jgi:hypothetical protein